jgi:hypothetical protein
MRQPTRTDLVEAHAAEIHSKRMKALDLRTAARAYANLAQSILNIAPEGDIHTQAREHMADASRANATICTVAADKLEAAAALLEQNGVD